jgi:YD repeat-containing protein
LAYTYYPYLKKQTQVSYENGASSTSISTFTYVDGHRMLATQTATNSNGDILSTSNTYPLDMIDAGHTVPYQAMADLHIVSPVVIKEQYKNSSTLLNATTFNYANWGGDVFAPQTVQVKKGSGAAETMQEVYAYDSYGNVLEQSKPGGTHEVYIWGYKGHYPVAKIVGSNYTTASSFIDQEKLDDAGNISLYTDADIREELDKLRINLPDALVTTITYAPLVGVTSQTDPQNRTTYYEYDNLGRLSVVRDKERNIVKRICYNYAGQPGDCASIPTAKPGDLIYARLSYENVDFLSFRADIVVRFYSDEAGTLPISVKNLPVHFATIDPCGEIFQLPGAGTAANGSYEILSASALLSYESHAPPCHTWPCPSNYCQVDYALEEDPGYIIIP